MKHIIPWLKNKIRFMSSWFKISFWSEKCSFINMILMYVRTLGCSLLLCEYLVNMIHEGWLEAFTTSSSSDIELRIVQMIDQRDSWINRISKSLLFSKIVSVRSLFLQTFCENIFRVFRIIVLPNPQISELNWLWFLRALIPSYYTTLCWTCISRIDRYCCWSNICPYSWCIWKYRCIVSLSLFQVLKDLSWSLLCSITLFL